MKIQRRNQMISIKPDIIAKVRLYSKDEGGRNRGLPLDRFGIPMFFEGEYFDCRLLLDQVGLSPEPGSVTIVPIKFLYPELIKPRLSVGKHFKLWEMKFIGEGEVLEVIN